MRSRRASRVKIGCNQPISWFEHAVIELSAKPAGWNVLKIVGPLRLAEADELLHYAKMLAAESGGVEIDLGSAEHVHAAGLQILRALERLCSSSHRPFRLGEISDDASDALVLCGLGHWREPAKDTDNGS